MTHDCSGRHEAQIPSTPFIALQTCMRVPTLTGMRLRSGTGQPKPANPDSQGNMTAARDPRGEMTMEDADVVSPIYVDGCECWWACAAETPDRGTVDSTLTSSSILRRDHSSNSETACQLYRLKACFGVLISASRRVFAQLARVPMCGIVRTCSACPIRTSRPIIRFHYCPSDRAVSVWGTVVPTTSNSATVAVLTQSHLF